MTSIEEWYRLIAMMRRGDPLPDKARQFVADVLDLVRRGEDPRPFAGTEPPDPRKNSRAIVGMHYWLLRAKYGKGGELAARTEVARVWKLSKERVKKIARNTSKAFRPMNPTPEEIEVTLEAILNEAPGGAMYKKRRPRKAIDPHSV